MDALEPPSDCNKVNIATRAPLPIREVAPVTFVPDENVLETPSTSKNGFDLNLFCFHHRQPKFSVSSLIESPLQ